MDIKANIDFNQLFESLKELNYGEVLIFFVIVSFVILIGLYILAKYGVISKKSSTSLSTDKEINKEIKRKTEFLHDKDLNEFKDAISYHIQVYKLGEFLKTKNKDIDVLKYALYSFDSSKTLKLYERGKDFIEKDKTTKKFKFKNRMNLKKVKIREKFAIFLYILINFIGTLPYLGQVFISLFKLNIGRWFSTLDQFIIFIIFFILSLIVVTFLLNPRAAQTFLEMERIQTKVDS
ncbi:hypothetical protein [Acinetobacter bereziniae]|uniref:hypothetical protein n=1 Tax=Acinetobacter bereziniae TaxID=106648 RepID=UPI003AF5E049